MRWVYYVARRLLWLLPVLLGVSLLTFLISSAVPGDPARIMVGSFATEEVVAKAREELGLNLPLHQQYLRYLSRVVKGDFGTSLTSRRAVVTDLVDYLPATIELAMAGLVIAVLIGIPLGVISAYKRDRMPDHIGRFLALFGVAMPTFWLGLMLLVVFYLWLDWLPGVGRIDGHIPLPASITGLYLIDSLLAGNWGAFVSALRHLILPAFCESVVIMGILARMTRSSMLEVLRQDYIKTARAKGVMERVVLFRHALKNAMLPIITVIGMIFGHLIGGSVLVEYVFSWPGIGQYAVRAISYLDFPAIMGVTILAAATFVTVNLLVDLAYFWIDPRIKLD